MPPSNIIHFPVQPSREMPPVQRKNLFPVLLDALEAVVTALIGGFVVFFTIIIWSVL